MTRSFVILIFLIGSISLMKNAFCDEVPSKPLFDWQKDPEFSREMSSSSEESGPEPASIMDVILSTVAPNRSDVLAALQPIQSEKSHKRKTTLTAKVTKLNLVPKDTAFVQEIKREKRTLTDEQIETIFKLQRDAGAGLLLLNRQAEVLVKNFRDFSTNLLTIPAIFTSTRSPMLAFGFRPLDAFSRKKRQTSSSRPFRLDVETIENLQSLLDILKTMASRWNNVNERLSRMRLYMQTVMGLPIPPQLNQLTQIDAAMDRCSSTS